MGAHPEKAKSKTGPTSGSRPPRNSEPLGDAEKSEFFADADLKTEPLTTKPATTEPTTTKVAPAEAAEPTVVSDDAALPPVVVDNYAEPIEPSALPSPASAVSADPVSADPVSAAPVTSGASRAHAERDAVDDPPAEPRRTWRQNIGQAGYTLVPYWFVASGVLLGVGGVVEDKALAGACGALAGVTAGLVYQNRARYYRRQAESLRDRLRTQRLESETAAASMRESMRALRTEVWELRLSARVFEMTTQFEASRAYDPEEKARIAALATQPLDLSELHDTPLAASVAAELAASLSAPGADVAEPAADVAIPAPDAETISPAVDLTKPADSADSADEKPAEIDQSAEPAPAEPEVIEATTKDDETSEPPAVEATDATAGADAAEDDTDDVAGAPVDGGEKPGPVTKVDAVEDKASEDVTTLDAVEDKGTEDAVAEDAVAEGVVAQDKPLDDPAVEDDDAAEGQGARVIDLRGASNKPPTQQEHTAVAG